MDKQQRPVTFRCQRKQSVGGSTVMRRVAAAVVMLAAALLMHFATPHHSTLYPAIASAPTPAVEPESRKLQGPSPAASRAGAPSQHKDEMADVIARPPRAVGPEVQPPTVDTTAVSETITSLAPSGPAQPRTARDAWNPGAGTPPTPSTLQTFRC